jgi:RsiW-degrading membrane proteinase PrsW (M82 family)
MRFASGEITLLGIMTSQIAGIAGDPETHFIRLPPRLWKLLLVGGLGVWLFSAVISEITGDTVLVPTVIIVGSFLVPMTVAAFALSRPRGGYLTTEEVAIGFFAAGTLAVITSALLETYLLPDHEGTFIAVGLFEELGKGAVLLAVAHEVHNREPRDGMVLGVVVGAGFAAFESAGYALQALLDSRGNRIVDVMELEAFRAMLAPFGHITWTALLGGALFASSRGGRFHLTRRLGLTFLGVVTLHALWDQSYGWAVTLTKGLVEDSGWHLLWPNAQFWAQTPAHDVMVWFNVIYNVLLWANALVGAVWIIRTWRGYGRRTVPEPPMPAAYA